MQINKKAYFHTAYLQTIGHVYGENALRIIKRMTRDINGWFIVERVNGFIIIYKH